MPMSCTSWLRRRDFFGVGDFLYFPFPPAFRGNLVLPEPRKGDEIVAAGQFFHTGTRVVLWMDPGGFDGYRVERRFVPFGQSSFEESQPHLDSPGTPNRYDIRTNSLTAEQLERVRGGGWDLATLQSNVDQFVLHFDVAGTSRNCFNVLQDRRDLSIHFMCDLDGTIYQTIDLKERASSSCNNCEWSVRWNRNREHGFAIAKRKRPARRVVQKRGGRSSGDHDSEAVWEITGARGSFCWPPGAAGDGCRGSAGERTASIRFYAAAIQGARAIDGGAVRGFSED